MPIELEALIQSEKLPCSEEAAQIIMHELEMGNTIRSFGNVGTLPDDSYYIILFTNLPKGNYSNIKTQSRQNNLEYMLICLTDNHGGVEIRFGF